MFGALRRCPATLSKNLSAAAIASRSLRAPLSHPVSALRVSTLRLGNASVAGFHHSAKWQQIAAEAHADSAPAEHSEPITQFKDLQKHGLVHHNVIDTIVNQMRLTTMTDVQVRTINEALSGVDVIAQAKTGTGKTLGFLIPIIQRIINADPKLGERVRGYSRTKPDDIRAIIISPTRELAEQIAVEARKVVSKTGIVIQVAVGGTQKRAMLQKTQREGCHILIGTPGRINDIFSDPYSGVKAPKLNALVMDEADRLLDDGFTKEIDEIKTFLPDPEEVERQNLMFSATIPRDVVDLVRRTMRPGFHFAKCVSEDEEPTHERVPQQFVDVAGFENIMPSLYELVLKQHEASRAGETRPFKAIIYFNSTAEVTLGASVFFKLSGGFKRNTPLSGLRGYEIHAKLSQAQRTRAADDFRHCNSGVMFSSDVTARGMDFPNVTHVIQVGLPRDRDTYIHRLGRTGRAGKEGEGWILVTPFERAELRKRLRGLPLADATAQLETASIDMSQTAEVPEQVGKILTDVVDAHKKVYPDQLDAAFRGLFGSYQWLGDKRGLLEGANRLAEFGWGMPTPPQPPSSFFASMGSGRRDRGGRSFGGGRDRGSFGGGRDGGSFGGERDRGSFGGGRDRGSFGGGRSDSYSSRQGGFNDRRGSDRSGQRRFNNDRTDRNRDRGDFGGGDRPRREARFDF